MENEGLIGYYNEVYRRSGREGLSVKGKNGKAFIVWTAGLALLGISVTLSVYGGKINARHAPGESMNARDEAGGLTVAGKEADESIGVEYGLEALANVFEISDNPVYSAQKAGKVSEGREEESALRLSGIRDIYLAKGQECDFLEGVFAESGKGGKDAKPAGKVAVDASKVKTETEGVYPLYYSVTDSQGGMVQGEAKVTVADAAQIQKWIDTRQINRREARIVGAPKEYDAGVCTELTLEENLEYLRPALVRLRHELEDGGFITGSGFLMDISEGRIWISTNRHVVEKYPEWEVSFYDGSKVQGVAAGVSGSYDIAVIAVEWEKVPGQLAQELRTVHIDLEYWNQLKEKEVEIGLLRIDLETGEESILSGKLVRKKTAFPWGNGEEETEMAVGLESGDSGSAVFDQYGYLISMAYGTSHDIGGDRDWGIPLDEIVSNFHRIVENYLEDGYGEKRQELENAK